LAEGPEKNHQNGNIGFGKSPKMSHTAKTEPELIQEPHGELPKEPLGGERCGF
jgi:hypothetical protein